MVHKVFKVHNILLISTWSYELNHTHLGSKRISIPADMDSIASMPASRCFTPSLLLTYYYLILWGLNQEREGGRKGSCPLVWRSTEDAWKWQLLVSSPRLPSLSFSVWWLTASFIILIGPIRRVKTFSVKLGCMYPSPFTLILYDLFFFCHFKTMRDILIGRQLHSKILSK